MTTAEVRFCLLMTAHYGTAGPSVCVNIFISTLIKNVVGEQLPNFPFIVKRVFITGDGSKDT